ncbi:MAG: hypothetical protein HQM09_11925 [Candidatus Riflebacteria bacterium]|nr:hypothetical protein [Candidatus Riflebacteria bacterium]
MNGYRRSIVMRSGHTALQWALMFGILTFLLLPFVQLWSIEAIPLFASDDHRRAAVALENLLSEAQSRPFSESIPKTEFRLIPGYENMGLEGRIEILPHPDISGLTLMRAQVRWGFIMFRRLLSLEVAVTQTHL